MNLNRIQGIVNQHNPPPLSFFFLVCTPFTETHPVKHTELSHTQSIRCQTNTRYSEWKVNHNHAEREKASALAPEDFFML